MKKTISVISVLAVLIGVFMLTKTNLRSHFTYVITETGMVNSFDPLDADQTVNLPVARMIYTTPIEVDQKGDLRSLILDAFDYNEATFTMTWKVKSGIKFTDGTEIKPIDVAFAISRMAYTRPTFPVLEDISGLKRWLNEKNPLATLPSGINLEDRTIKISFDKKQDHPLFRFCLEIFSIIPSSCVDINTNKIACKEIPGSGHYKIVNQLNAELHFEKRDKTHIFDLPVPQKITFKYLTSTQAIENSKNMDLKTIISGTELKYSLEEMKQLEENAIVSYAPASRIVGFVLNPNAGAFRDLRCRL